MRRDELSLCLSVLGGYLPAQKKEFTMDFCLCGANLNLKAFCIGAIPDIMIELIVYGSVSQSRQAYRIYLLQGPGKRPYNLTSTGPHFS